MKNTSKYTLTFFWIATHLPLKLQQLTIFWIQTNKNSNFYEVMMRKRKMFVICTLIKMSIYIIANFYDFRSNNVLASSYLSYRICSDLYSAANLGHDKDTEVMIRVIKTYVMSIAVFDHLIHKNCEPSRNFPKKTLHLADLSDKRKNILFWLGGFRFYDVEKTLKVSGLFLAISLHIYVSNIMY